MEIAVVSANRRASFDFLSISISVRLGTKYAIFLCVDLNEEEEVVVVAVLEVEQEGI